MEKNATWGTSSLYPPHSALYPLLVPILLELASLAFLWFPSCPGDSSFFLLLNPFCLFFFVLFAEAKGPRLSSPPFARSTHFGSLLVFGLGSPAFPLLVINFFTYTCVFRGLLLPLLNQMGLLPHGPRW